MPHPNAPLTLTPTLTLTLTPTPTPNPHPHEVGTSYFTIFDLQSLYGCFPRMVCIHRYGCMLPSHGTHAPPRTPVHTPCTPCTLTTRTHLYPHTPSRPLTPPSRPISQARDPTYWIGTLSIALGAILPHLALRVIKFQLNPEPYQVVQYYERTLSKRRKKDAKERSPSQQPLQPGAEADGAAGVVPSGANV